MYIVPQNKKNIKFNTCKYNNNKEGTNYKIFVSNLNSKEKSLIVCTIFLFC